MKKPIPVLLLFILCPFAPSANPIHFSGGYTRLQMADGAKQILLSGGAQLDADSLSLEAQTITLRGDEYRYVSCVGNVTILDEEQGLKLATPSMDYDREGQKITIHSWVEITDTLNDVAASAGNLLFSLEQGTMEMESHVRLLRSSDKGTMVCRADRMFFDRKSRTLVLTGTASVTYRGDTYQAHTITVRLDTEEIVMDGSIKGVVHG